MFTAQPRVYRRRFGPETGLYAGGRFTDAQVTQVRVETNAAMQGFVASLLAEAKASRKATEGTIK